MSSDRVSPSQVLDALRRDVDDCGKETFDLLRPVAEAVRPLAEKYSAVSFFAYVSPVRMASLLTWKRVPEGTLQYTLDGLPVRSEPGIDGGTLRVITESDDADAARDARRELFAAMGWRLHE